MRNLNLRTVLIVVTTLALAIAAILGAWMLYRTRFQAIAPTAPKGAPAAETPTSQCTVSFSLAAATASPTGTATASPTGSSSPTASPTRTASPTTSPTGTAGPTSTTSPTASPGSGGATQAPGATSTTVAKGGASASPSTLPVAGVSWPGVAAAIGGILILVFGILLAF